MKSIILTNKQAREFLLHYHGLAPPYDKTCKADVLDYIRKTGCIQFDPLNIVGNNCELVLQSRVCGFKPDMLKELLYIDRKLVDGWDKHMSIYCIEDLPFFARKREAFSQHTGKTRDEVNSILPVIRKLIKEKGPISSLDLDFGKTVDWPWAPTRLARAALESMFFWGELIIHHKVNTRRYYDFASSYIPQEILSAPEPNPSQEQFYDWYVLRRIGSIGLLWEKAGPAWLGVWGLKSKDRKDSFKRLVEQKKIIQLFVENIKIPFYIKAVDKPFLDKILESGPLSEKQAVILAPLDNLLWDRALIKDLFQFDYCWEVYKPKELRNHGYYVLPVLYGNSFIARFEPGYDKKKKIMTIKNWWWEPGIRITKKLEKDLRKCFKQFLDYLGADTLLVDKPALKAGVNFKM